MNKKKDNTSKSLKRVGFSNSNSKKIWATMWMKQSTQGCEKLNRHIDQDDNDKNITKNFS